MGSKSVATSVLLAQLSCQRSVPHKKSSRSATSAGKEANGAGQSPSPRFRFEPELTHSRGKPGRGTSTRFSTSVLCLEYILSYF